MTTSAELAQGLTDLTAQLAKVQTESNATLAKVTELEAVIANVGGVSPAVDAAFQALKAQVQLVDDLIPDVAAVPTPAPVQEPVPIDPVDPEPTPDPAAPAEPAAS